MYNSALVKLLFTEASNDILHQYNIAKLYHIQKQVRNKLYIQLVDHKAFSKKETTLLRPNLNHEIHSKAQLLFQHSTPKVQPIAPLQSSYSPIVSNNIVQLKCFESILDSYYKILYKLNTQLDVTIMPPMAPPTTTQLEIIQKVQPVLPPIEDEVDVIFVDPNDYEYLDKSVDAAAGTNDNSNRLAKYKAITENDIVYPTEFYHSVYDRDIKVNNSLLWSPPFKSVVLGGTFDRLHPGHKILLSMAAMLCSEYMEIGVTDNSILTSKKYSFLIAPYKQRSDITFNFMKRLNPFVEYNMLQLFEPYANTQTSKRLEVIVFSPETNKTALFINEKRLSNSLKPLELYEITYFDGVDQGTDSKLSSTYLRELDFKKLNNNNNQ